MAGGRTLLKYTHLCTRAHYSEPVPSVTQTKGLRDAGSGYGRTLSRARPAKAVQVTYGRVSYRHHRGSLAPASDRPRLIWRPRPVQPSAFSFCCHRFTEPVTISFRGSVKCVWGMVPGAAVGSGQVGLWAEAEGGSVEDKILSRCQSCHRAHRTPL